MPLLAISRPESIAEAISRSGLTTFHPLMNESVVYPLMDFTVLLCELCVGALCTLCPKEISERRCDGCSIVLRVEWFGDCRHN